MLTLQRNELWDQESVHSGSYMPPKAEYSYDYPRTQSTYSHGGYAYGQPIHPMQTRSTSPVSSRYQMSQFRQSLYQSPYQGPYGGSTADFRSSRMDMAHRPSLDDTSSFHQPYQPAPRPQSSYAFNLPDPSSDSFTAPAVDYLGAQAITDSQLERSIRKICANAELDKLTKKGVRKELEREYGVELTERREAINRLVEKVLTE